MVSESGKQFARSRKEVSPALWGITGKQIETFLEMFKDEITDTMSVRDLDKSVIRNHYPRSVSRSDVQ